MCSTTTYYTLLTTDRRVGACAPRQRGARLEHAQVVEHGHLVRGRLRVRVRGRLRLRAHPAADVRPWLPLYVPAGQGVSSPDDPTRPLPRVEPLSQ